MPLREDLLTPIAGDNPSGKYLKYDPVYDKIKEARREEVDAPQGEWASARKVADWATVLKLGQDALATKTKDLQLAAWITEAALKKEGFSGLKQGLILIKGLLDNFWDTIYPEIEDGDAEMRAAPLEWVGNYLDEPLRHAPLTKAGYGFYKYKESRATGSEEDASTSDTKAESRARAIEEGKITVEEFDSSMNSTATATYEGYVADLDATTELLDQLNDFCNEKFGDVAPSYSKLRNAVEEVRHTANSLLNKKYDKEGRRKPAEEEAVEEEQVEESSSGDSGGYQAAETPSARPARRKAVSGSIEPQDIEEIPTRLDAIAKFLRTADPSSPGPYLLLRGYRWGELRGFGESPDPMMLAAPTSETRQNLRRLYLEQNWAELLEAVEVAASEPCCRAWLDLQRYAVKAAENIGYPAIGTAIQAELRALLADLPGILDWTLMDDTPTANNETRAWLQEFCTPAAPAAEEPQHHYYSPPPAMEAERSSESESEESAAAEPDAYQMAMEAARSGRSREALEILAQDIPRQQSGRARFQRKLQLAQLCMSTGHESIATPILEGLAAEIDEHKLEEWEAADVVAHPLAMLYRTMGKGADATLQGKLYARICRLDPLQALSVSK